MDTPTQALLGATFGQALFGHRLGRKAAWFGAVGGVLPDLDGLVVQPLGPFATWVYHRGPTHAFWFAPLVGALLGYAVWRWYARRGDGAAGGSRPPGVLRACEDSSVLLRRPTPAGCGVTGTPETAATYPRYASGFVHPRFWHPARIRRASRRTPKSSQALAPGARAALPWWMGLFFVAIATHPLLDIFTSYGTQLLTPLANTRFALDAIAIVDPAYSLVLVAALLLGRRFRHRPAVAQVVAALALVLTTAYLFYALAQNDRAAALAHDQLRAEGVERADVHAFPTIFQPWVRRVVARTPDGTVRVGHVSTLVPQRIGWRTYPPVRTPEVVAARATWQGRLFGWFTSGWFLAQRAETPEGPVVRFYDLRIGIPGDTTPGMWGIEARFTRSGAEGSLRLGSVERFRGPIDRVGERLAALWQATVDGDTSQL